jgi:thioredoxin-like negative regulator of GroEL
MSRNKVFDALDKTFQTMPTESNPVKPPALSDKNDVNTDFRKARETLEKAMSYSEQAAEGILNVAMSSDNPRAYEVAGQIIKTMGEQAKDMMEVQEKKHRIDDKTGDTQPRIQTQNNVVFAGTTSDILKAIRDEESKTIEHEPD